MSDSTGVENAGDEQDIPPLPEGQDWLLAQLVSWAEMGFKIGVTVMARGETVGGILVSQRDYIENMRSGFAANMEPSTITESVDNTFQIILDALADVEKDDDVVHPLYLHLKDARVLTGNGGIPQQDGLWWRGKISSVDGFWLGSTNEPQ